MRNYDYAVVIGRFQPVHKGHEHLLAEASKVADNVLVLVGSSFKAPTTKNPFTFEDRSRMLMLAASTSGTDIRTLTIRGINDYTYNDKMWLMEVQETIDKVVYKGFVDKPRVCIVGFSKDIETSSYLKMFPQYDYVEISQGGPIDASTVRNLYFANDAEMFEKMAPIVLSKPIYRYLLQWKDSDEFQRLVEESEFIDQVNKAWSFAPYEPIFVTTDAVIIESGHILLIKRGEHPGRGQWALPGGYLEANEDIVTSCIREIHEETGLKVPKKVLRGSIKARKVFDAPGRDPRGRFVTHTFLFDLAPCPDPKRKFTKIQAADDAASARWVPLSHLHDMSADFFIDHYDIINDLIGGLY